MQRRKSRSTQIKCHYCRLANKSVKIIPCVNYQDCHHAFCHNCIKSHFKKKGKPERIIPNGWVCYICRGMCRCDRCHLELVKELSLIEDQIANNPDINLPFNLQGDIFI